MKMANFMRVISLLMLLGIFSAQLLAAPKIQKLAESTMTTRATTWWDSRYGNGYLNSMSYSQDSLISYKGWQYAAYYDANRHVALKRRHLPSGLWEGITFMDYTQTVNDNHNNISIGISPIDGRIHLAFDHHDATLHYRASAAGIANNPTGFSWTNSLFGAVKNNLDNTAISPLSYPRFITAPDGTLTFEGRLGQSGDGESWLWRYDNDGTWTQQGKFIENSYNGGDANAYFFGIQYDANNRLHATWVWRENFGGNSNHDIMYAYSDDHGRTWRNNAGSLVANTGSSFITRDSNVKIWTIPTDTGLINQESMVVDLQGRVHVLARQDIAGINKQMHYWRDTHGHWTQTDTGLPTKIWANRSKLAYDSVGNIYAIMPNIQIASASVSSNYQDWVVVNVDDNGQFNHSEPLIDSYGLKQGNNELYVYAQKGTVNSTSSTIAISKYSLNGPAFSGWSLCANEAQLCEFSGKRTVRFGANGNYYSRNYTDATTCSKSVFGDPLSGVEKVCEVYLNANETLSDWVYCADEGETCSFSGTREVRYGAQGSYDKATFTGSAACGNNTFGDPIRGLPKACFYHKSGALVGTWRIVNRKSSKCLRTENSSLANAAQVVQYACDASAIEQWRVVENGSGIYNIVQVASGKYADISGASIRAGGHNIIWPNNGGNNQKWRIEDQGNGYFHIINVKSNLLLDISGASIADNAKNIQWSANGGANQDWQFIK
jgi:hypothetical protein